MNLVGPGLVEKSEGLFNAGKLGILGTFIVAGLAGGGLTLGRLSPAEWPPFADVVGAACSSS